MLAQSPLPRPALAGLAACLTLALALPAAAQSHQGHAHAQQKVDASAGPVKALYDQRQYEASLRKADELKAAGTTDAANEYWAARALRVLKRFDESQQRFQELSRSYPGAEEAGQADVDAWVAALGKMPKGEYTPKDKKFAADCGQSLIGAAAKHAKDPSVQARAYYIAGNAFRMAQADAEAAGAYESCRVLTAAHDTGYPDKCTLGLASIKARTYDVAAAEKLYRECALQDRDASTAKRCAKSLARVELVGHESPELVMETWFNGDAQTLAAHRGKVVLLFFFATWCPHCKQTLPTLPRYLEKYEGQPFEILAVTNNSKGQTTEGVSLFVQDPQWKISYPVGVDARGATTMAMEATGIPQVILIDKKGVVRWSDHPAYLKDEMIEALIAEPGGA